MRYLLAMALTAALAPVAIAASAALIDYDSDGVISRIEFETAVAVIATQADANGDGIIDATEFNWTAADRRLFDNDRDGRIMSVGIQEFCDGMNLAFNALDRDMNDALDASEVKAGEAIYGILGPRPTHAASASSRGLGRKATVTQQRLNLGIAAPEQAISLGRIARIAG